MILSIGPRNTAGWQLTHIARAYDTDLFRFEPQKDKNVVQVISKERADLSYFSKDEMRKRLQRENPFDSALDKPKCWCNG